MTKRAQGGKETLEEKRAADERELQARLRHLAERRAVVKGPIVVQPLTVVGFELPDAAFERKKRS
jgi:hypothetical protein